MAVAGSGEWLTVSWMLAVVLAPAVGLKGQEPSGPGGREDLRAMWSAAGERGFGSALEPGIGFSLTYDGQDAGPVNPAGWRVATQKTADSYETTFRHPSGLVALRRARVFAEFEAVEYTVRLKNAGQEVLPAVSAINALEVSFTGKLVDAVSVVTSGGGTAEARFPPKNFAMQRTLLGLTPPGRTELTLAGEGGMPSSVLLPIFFVENEQRGQGMFVSVGWCGPWKATVRVENGGRLRLRGGMPGLNLRLRPGEEISGPQILLGAYRGPLSAGANRLRRLVRAHYAPKVGDKELLPIALYTTWFDIGAELDEKLFLRLADRAAEIGQEVMLLDAGWYAGTPSHRYSDMAGTWPAISNSLGNWELGEERRRFPSGLKTLAEHVRSKGMQFGLWFEPERSGPHSLLAQKHPDWVIRPPKGKWWLVDFGRPEVQDYFCQIFDRYIRELDLRYVRWDCNIEPGPLPFLASQEAADRRGLGSIRYAEGLQRVEEYLRRRHPQVVLESCAGGGRRIDLATLQRRHTIWISDQTMNADIVRFHLEGLNHFLPGSGLMVGLTPSAAVFGRREPLPDLVYQSYFGGAFGVAGRIHEWPEPMVRQMRRHVEVFKQLRRYLAEDYYPLASQSRVLETWAGWQFHDRAAQEGFVQAFRVRAAEQSRRFPLKGLAPERTYAFVDPYSGEEFEARGAVLLREGLEFNLPTMTSRVWLYRPVAK